LATAKTRRNTRISPGLRTDAVKTRASIAVSSGATGRSRRSVQPAVLVREEGDIDGASVHPRQVVKRALKVNVACSIT
jgi:hypothetical protein